MKLIIELDQLNEERKQQQLMEDHSALLWMIIENAAELMKRGGFDLTIENLSEFCFLEPEEVQAAIAWRQGKKKKRELPFELNSKHSPLSKLDRVKAALLWCSNRTLASVKARKKKYPESFRHIIGVQTLCALSGIGRKEFLEIVEQNKESILATFPNFKDAWVADNLEIRQKNAKNQDQDTKIQLIRQAVMDISGGKLATVTAADIEKWKGHSIGYSSRQIDNLLSTHAELRDLDKYRKYGKTTMRPTDKDREIAYRNAALA